MYPVVAFILAIVLFVLNIPKKNMFKDMNFYKALLVFIIASLSLYYIIDTRNELLRKNNEICKNVKTNFYEIDILSILKSA